MASATLLTSFFALTLLMQHGCAAAAPPRSLYHEQTTKTWCVANPSAGEAALRANLEFACSEGECGAIQGSAGGCSFSGDLPPRASVAMNSYYQARGRNPWNCFFNGTGLITITDPSSGNCKYD